MPEIKKWGTKAAIAAGLLCLAQVNALADFTFDIGGSSTRAFYPGTAARGTDLEFDRSALSLATLLSYYDRFDSENSLRHFVFTAPHGSGSFDLSVTQANVSDLRAGSNGGRVKHIAPSPEPAVVLLTSAFMLGVIVLFRKRLGSC